MPKVPENLFYGLAVFCFFIALIQFFLNSQPTAAAVFAVFGLLAMLLGWIYPDHEDPSPKVEDESGPKP